jgi:hypothetical protein
MVHAHELPWLDYGLHLNVLARLVDDLKLSVCNNIIQSLDPAQGSTDGFHLYRERC